MTRLALIRHGATAWNAEDRIQGRSDVGLSPEGRAELARLGPPPELDGFVWIASPLARARQTAACLGRPEARPEPRLIEAHWGAYEGLRRDDTRAHAARAHARSRPGLDWRPPGGESLREVQARLSDLFADLARDGRPVAAIAHKGVIRAALSLATGWDMASKAPVRLAWRAAHLFDLAPDGTPSLARANVALARKADEPA